MSGSGNGMMAEGTVTVPRTAPALSGMMVYYLFSYCSSCSGNVLSCPSVVLPFQSWITPSVILPERILSTLPVRELSHVGEATAAGVKPSWAFSLVLRILQSH